MAETAQTKVKTQAVFTSGPWARHDTETHAEITGPDDKAALALVAKAEDADLIAAAPSLYSDAEFLCARIRELEAEMSDDDELSRQYFGHVLPAVARMESALAEARGAA